MLRLISDITKDNKDEKDRKEWDAYADSPSMPDNKSKTDIFYSSLPVSLKKDFDSSTKRMLQLGMSSAWFLKKIATSKNREVIGYDYSETAVKNATKQGHVTARLIDLTKIDDNGELAYAEALKTDLSVPTDVLLIHVLEYLNPRAVRLLMFALMDEAKPNSNIYFDFYRPINKYSTAVDYHIEEKLLISFFAARTDFTFKHICQNEDSIKYNKVSAKRDCFVAIKR